MKCLMTGLLALGLGWFGYPAEELTSACSPPDSCAVLSDCQAGGGDCDADCEVVDVECLPDGTCRIECEGPDGETCWAIVACDPDGGCQVLECGGDLGCEESAEDVALPACETPSRAAACETPCAAR